MREYTLETVWPIPPADVQAEVIAFWLKESALSEGKARERADQLLVICRDDDRKIAGVSTALPILVDSLGLRCYFFRAFIGRSHRVRGLRSTKLIHRLVRQSYAVLNDRYQRGFDSSVVGLYLEIENPSIQRRRDELVWSDDGANVVFIGLLPNGHHARVCYFDNARIPQSLLPKSARERRLE